MRFRNHIDLEVSLTEMPVNQSDQEATHMMIKAILPFDDSITGSLYKDDVLLTDRRVYSMSRNMPFNLSDDQKELLENKKPNATWSVPIIKLWLDKNGITYMNESKEQLLSKVEL